MEAANQKINAVVSGLCCALAVLYGAAAEAQVNPDPKNLPPILEKVRIEEHLKRKLPLNLAFRNQDGRTVRLADLLDKKRPVLLNFVYHSCPMLCSLVLDATVEAIKQIDWTLGKDYQAWAISIDPRDTPAKAAEKRKDRLRTYGRREAASAWQFLVGDQESITALTRAAGFYYTYDQQSKEYAHPAVVLLLTPDGTIARYVYGLSFRPNDLRLGLFEASQGRSMNTLEKLILFCYHFDPKGAKYVLAARRVMQIGGAITAVLLAATLLMYWRRELQRKLRPGLK